VLCVCAAIVQSGPPEAAMLQYVMHLLAVEDIEGLPPGGGINAKLVFPLIVLCVQMAAWCYRIETPICLEMLKKTSLWVALMIVVM